jgi:beta-lactamase regulating signal transducer with metallopeptidase domain
MLCLLYVTTVGMLLGLVGLIVERMLPTTAARRWLWSAIIPMSVALPGYYGQHHTWSVLQALDQRAAQPSMTHASLSALDPAWWEHIRSLNPIINRYWIIVSGVLVIWGLANAMRVSYLVALSRDASRDRRNPPVVDGVPVLVTNQLGPATVGLLRSLVLVPRWVLALPERQRQYVLRHEDEHRRAHDATLLFVASLPIVLMPWNPALWWQVRRLCLAVELDCDNRVVKALGDAPAYGELLLKVAQAGSRGPRLQPAFLGGTGSLERRLTALVAPTPLRHAQKFALPAVAMALLLLVLWMPHPVLGSMSHAHGAMATATLPQQ